MWYDRLLPFGLNGVKITLDGAKELHDKSRPLRGGQGTFDWVGLMRNDVDMALEINKESVEFLKGAARFETYTSIQPYYIPLVFNIRNPMLARVDVRRAIADAINRKEIVSQGMRGQAQEAEDPVWPFHWSYNTAPPGRTFKPEMARERLDAAGLPVRAAAPGRRASRFQLKCMFYNRDPQFERIGLLLQRQLAAVGIDLVLEGLTGPEMQNRLRLVNSIRTCSS